jgi:ABC-type transport system involved in multi-copper enzyme maturation permease subunit
VTRIIAIASVTVREALRQKLAVNLVVFAVAILAASITISTLTFGEQYRIIANLGLSAMEVFGTLIVTFLGANLVARDVERRTVYPVLTKPVSRAHYVFGRYLGLLATATLNLLVMAAVFLGVLAVYLGGPGFLRETPVLAVLLAMAIQFAMVGAIATLFSTFSTGTLATIFTLSAVVAGHLSSDLVRYWATRGALASVLGKIAYVLVPNLEALDLKDAMVYKETVATSFYLTGAGYGILYAAAVAGLAAALFSRRDLK